MLFLTVGCGGGERQESVAADASGGEGNLAVTRVVTGNPPRRDVILVSKAGELAGELVPAGSFSGFQGVSWSPDGRRFAFAGSAGPGSFEGDEPTDVYVGEVGGGEPSQLTESGRALAPVWSPDGDRIVFAERSPGPLFPVTATIWSIRADGTGKARLLEPERGRADVPSSFAPVGSRLAFTRSTWPEPAADGLIPNTAAVHLLDLETLRERKVADRASGGAFSPDGGTLAYATDRDENGELSYGDFVHHANELYLLDLESGKTRRLTETRDLNELAPSWSPDGELLAYQRGEVIDNAEGTVVMTIRVDGTCPRRVVHAPGLDVWYTNPVWRPGPASVAGDRACPPDAEPEPVPLAGNLTLAEARAFRDFPLYWLGPRFGESFLSSIDAAPTSGARGRGDRVDFHYGNVQVQQQHVCVGVPADIDLAPARELELRGVKVSLYEGGTHAELVTGTTAVTVFGERPQVVEAIEALRPIGTATTPDDDLPAPVEGADTGELPC